MITYDMIKEAQDGLLAYWGENGKKVIEETSKVNPFNGNTSEFLNHCYCCGGNWVGMFLSGIKKLYPNVWEVIPESMGHFSFLAVCYTLILCGVDTSSDD